MRFDRVVLRAGKLSREVHVACEASNWRELVSRLQAAFPDEACTFVLTRPSVGERRTTVLMRETIWPITGDVKATPHSLEISADYISRALDAAIDSGPSTGICLVHTHPPCGVREGKGKFSPRDDWYEDRLFPTFLQERKQALFASIVLGSKRDQVDARAWFPGGAKGRTQPAKAVRVVGPEVRLIETPSSGWEDHPDPDVMNRSTRLWGVQGRRRLQNLRVGVVGSGGIGSIVLVALATMGVGSIRAWDGDILSKQNLHRVLAVTAKDVRKKKVLALAPYLRKAGTAKPFLFEPIAEWATTDQGLKQLKDCDIVFCCVDRFDVRVPLNDFAYSHLVPVIDIASWIHPTKTGTVDALFTHAHVYSPGIPCAWCNQTLSSYRLMQEAQGKQRGIEQRAPYGLDFRQTDGVEPSVLPLNLTGVGLALMEFMQVVLQIADRTPRDLKFLLPNWELDESDLNGKEDCGCHTDVALGDSLTIRPCVPPERLVRAAETSKSPES